MEGAGKNTSTRHKRLEFLQAEKCSVLNGYFILSCLLQIKHVDFFFTTHKRLTKVMQSGFFTLKKKKKYKSLTKTSDMRTELNLYECYMNST